MELGGFFGGGVGMLEAHMCKKVSETGKRQADEGGRRHRCVRLRQVA